MVTRPPVPRPAHPAGNLIPTNHPMANNQVSQPTSICQPNNPMVIGPPISGPITTTPTTTCNSTMVNASGQFPGTVPHGDMMPGSRQSIPPPPYSTPSDTTVMNQVANRTSPAIPVSSVAATLSLPMSMASQSTPTPCSMASTSTSESSFPPPSQPGMITTNANSENTVMPTSIHTKDNAIGSQSIPAEMTEVSQDTSTTQIKVEVTTDTPIKTEPVEESEGKEIKTEPKAEPMEVNTTSTEETTIKQEPFINKEPKSPAACTPSEISSSSEPGSNSKGDKPANSGSVPMRRPAPTPPKPAQVVCPPAPKDRPPLFKPDELRQHLVPTLDKLYRQDPDSIPFRQPVDPQALGIPDYFDIIKKPMDLSTIKRKLDTGQYVDPWDYVDDVWLMFDNAWIYNRKTSRVYRYCTKVRSI